ncbi:MAG TPA: 1-phosphofructokinase [Candidatus Sulfotelmatobacter sp.]|nr:1-phosphofructokinase [Candidatus Sulfotelmatobacter sp.]
MSNPVVTVTLNPAIDQTVIVDGLTVGAVQRAVSTQQNAGGKGVNVASCLADWGVRVIAAGLLGEDNAAPFQALFAEKGIADSFVRIAGKTRTNIKIADRRSGQTTDINLPGLVADEKALRLLKGILNDVVGKDAWAVVAGSLPDGLPATATRAVVAFLKTLGCRVVLDASGEALALALAADSGGLPHCVKPNRAELAEWAGHPLADVPAMLEAARELLARGVALVVVSLGEEGALFVKDGEALLARLPPIDTVSTVGAGDAMVAGLVAGFVENAGLERQARLAVAFAAAKLARVGPHLPEPASVEALAGQAEIVRL